MVLSSTVGSGTSNSALIFSSAASATSGNSCSTATRSPSWTICTPGIALAAVMSTLFNLAPCAGGRSSLA